METKQTALVNLTSPYIYLQNDVVDKIIYYYNGIFCRTIFNISEVLCQKLEPLFNGISIRLTNTDYFNVSQN